MYCAQPLGNREVALTALGVIRRHDGGASGGLHSCRLICVRRRRHRALNLMRGRKVCSTTRQSECAQVVSRLPGSFRPAPQPAHRFTHVTASKHGSSGLERPHDVFWIRSLGSWEFWVRHRLLRAPRAERITPGPSPGRGKTAPVQSGTTSSVLVTSAVVALSRSGSTVPVSRDSRMRSRSSSPMTMLS